MTIPTSVQDAPEREQLLWKALTAVLSTPISLPVPLERQGSRSQVFRARQAVGVEIVIKLTWGRNSYPVEQWVYHEYACAGVPVPQILYYSPSLPSMGCHCLVMTMIDGVPLFTADANHAGLYGGAGGLLGKMHSVLLPVQRFGLGAFLASGQENRYGDWSEFVTSHHLYPASGNYLRRNGLWPDDAGDLAVLGAKIAAHRFRCLLNHGDFGPDHLLVCAGRIAGVIDPGEAFAGPPEYDLAHVLLYISESQLRQVLSHYPGEPNLEMIRVYATVIALHKAARAHQAGNLARAKEFAVLAQNAYLFLEMQDALDLGAKLPFDLPPGFHTDFKKIRQ